MTKGHPSEWPFPNKSLLPTVDNLRNFIVIPSEMFGVFQQLTDTLSPGSQLPCGIPTRRIKSVKRESERKES